MTSVAILKRIDAASNSLDHSQQRVMSPRICNLEELKKDRFENKSHINASPADKIREDKIQTLISKQSLRSSLDRSISKIEVDCVFPSKRLNSNTLKGIIGKDKK